MARRPELRRAVGTSRGCGHPALLKTRCPTPASVRRRPVRGGRRSPGSPPSRPHVAARPTTRPGPPVRACSCGSSTARFRADRTRPSVSLLEPPRNRPAKARKDQGLNGRRPTPPLTLCKPVRTIVPHWAFRTSVGLLFGLVLQGEAKPGSVGDARVLSQVDVLCTDPGDLEIAERLTGGLDDDRCLDGCGGSPEPASHLDSRGGVAVGA